MKYTFIFLFSMFVFGQSNCQSPTIPEWYLNYLFNSGQCGLSPRPVGLELMWNTTYSREFLLKKLKGMESVHKAKAIVFLGMLKDTSLIDYLEPYVTDSNEQVSRCAMDAIATIGGPRAVQILEDLLKKNDFDWIATIQIVNNLELNCSLSSIPLINEIRQRFKLYFDKSEKLRKKFDALVLKIERFNDSESSRRQLILNGIGELKGLSSNEDYSWAYFQIHRSKDKGYLPVLRSLQPPLRDLPVLHVDKTSLDDDPDFYRNPNAVYNSILRLRISLGEEQFTAEEQEYISNTYEMFTIDKRMPFIQEEIAILEPHYKDKYSERN